MGAKLKISKVSEQQAEEETGRIVFNLMKGHNIGAKRVESVDFCKYYSRGECPVHVHDQSEEIFYFLRGEGVFTLGSEQIAFKPGTRIDVPKGVSHGFVSSKDGTVEHIVCSVSL